MKEKIQKLGIVVGFFIIIGILFASYLKVKTYNDGDGKVIVSFASTEDDADCVLINQNGAAIMIDAAEKQDEENVLTLLDQNGVKELKYLILTHGDEDHIGCVKSVISHVKVDRVIAPYYQDDSNWDETIRFLEEQNISILYPTHNKKIQVGSMNLIVYPGLKKNYKEENDFSLAVLVSHENVNMLFAGDAKKQRTQELQMIHWPQLNLYKVPYHGRANSLTEDFFEMLKPQYAVVTSDGCDEVISECANKIGTRLFFTRQIPVQFVSDGNQLIISNKN